MFIIDKWKQKYIDQGKEIGYTEAIRYFEDFINTLNQEYKKSTWQEKVRDESKQTQVTSETNINRAIEDVMTWLNPLTEIINTKYFKTVFFDSVKSEWIKGVLDYIDFFEHTYEIKLQYSKTYPYLPELKNAFTEAYQNKLLVEEAEKVLK
jgi:hypothetical protein